MKPHTQDPAIAWYLPRPEFRERHEVVVRAPAEFVFEAAEHFELTSVPLVRAIFRMRERLMGVRAAAERDRRPFVESAQAMGWGILELRAGRERVMGAECRPWLADVTFEPLAPEEFAVDLRPDRVKIAWSLEATPMGPARARLASETRVAANDAPSLAKFRRYWRWARFGIVAIRWLVLPAIRRDAERRWREHRLQPGARAAFRPVEPRNAHALPR